MVQRCEDQEFWPFTYGCIMAATALAIIVQMEGNVNMEELLPSKITSFEELPWKSYPTTLLIDYF